MVLLLSWFCRKSAKYQVDVGVTNQNSESRKIIKIACILMILLLLILIIAFALTHQKSSNPESSTRFLAAKNFFSRANTSVSPCDDFYEHACGSFPQNYPIPAHRKGINGLTSLDDQAKNNMKVLLESNVTSTSTAIEKVKQYYQACLNEKDYVTKAAEVVFAEMKKIGQWPILQGWNPENFNFQKFLVDAGQNLLITAKDLRIFQFSLERVQEDQTRITFTLAQPKLLLKMKYYRKSDVYNKEIQLALNVRRNLIVEFEKDNGISTSPYLENELQEMFYFEKQMAHIMNAGGEVYQVEMKSFRTADEDFKRHLNISLMEYALATFPEVTHPFIGNNESMISLPVGFIEKLANVLKSVEPRVLKNYLMFNVFLTHREFLSQKYRDIEKEHVKETKPKSPLWVTCAKQVPFDMHMEPCMPEIISKKSREKILTMVEHLNNSFIEMVKDAYWMDSATKQRAIAKAEKMIALIGFNELAFDDTKLDKFYTELKWEKSDNFMDMHKKKEKWDTIKKMEKLMKPVDRGDFVISFDTANAFYSPITNSIFGTPQALNYGALGSFIGHELTHGFDNIGKQFDDQGNKKNWWSEETLDQYKNRSQCFIDQYSAMEVPGTGGGHIDGKRTLGENIADNGGVREAFLAFEKFLESNKDDSSLPGVEATSKQLFFYGYSQFWCSSELPGYTKELMRREEHSPERFRVNTVLQNSAEFSDAFGCPVGSPMNPHDKCVLW